MRALGLLLVACLIWMGDLSNKSAAALAPGQTQNNVPATPPKNVQGSDVPGQTNQPRSYLLRTQTNLVLVDVRVTDKGGRPVEGLKQESFHVLEDGKPQTITSFSMENVVRLATASSENGPPSVINLSTLPPNVSPTQVIQDHRLMVLFFDMTSMQVDDVMRALKAATDFVHSRMTPADLVAIVTYTSVLNVSQDFTNDRDALDKVLQAMRVGESSSLAQSGTTGDAGTPDVSGEEIVNQDVSAAFTPDETEFNIFNTDQKLAAIESLAKMLQGVPGRKSVIHFSSGVQKTGVDNDTQLRATTDAANRANVSLYTVDARGLTALPPGGDASTASPSGTGIYTGSAVHSQINSLHGSRETLATLATDTGGKTFYDLNDFGEAFRVVQSENSTYYLLGYSPSNTRSDGRFRRIHVEVDRPGVKVEARPGYFAPKDFRQFTRDDKEMQLEQAMDLDTPFVELPMAVETAYFRQADKKFYVVLAAKIPGSSVSFLKKSVNHQTEFDFAWQATDSAGHTVAALRDTLPVKLAPDTYEKVVNSNFLYEGGFVLAPGKYKLKVVARENESGKLGTFEQQLNLPDATASPFALSSVVLSNQLQDSSADAAVSTRRGGREETPNPLQLGSRSLLPSVTRVFRTNQNLYVYLESYATQTAGAGGSKNGASGGPPVGSANSGPTQPPSVALVFFRGTRKISEAGPFAGKWQSAKGGKASYFVQIPLDKYPPGRYWMQVNVLDPSAGRVAFARVPMAIMKAPATTAAARTGQ
jgi:VWFA-related protein